MQRLDKNDLSSLYPRAKTQRELDAELKLRQLINRPRFVATKVSTYLSINLFLLQLAYLFVVSIFKHIDNEGSVIMYVFMTALMALAATAAIIQTIRYTDVLLSHATYRTPLFYLLYAIIIFIIVAIFSIMLVHNSVSFWGTLLLIFIHAILTFCITRLVIIKK